MKSKALVAVIGVFLLGLVGGAVLDQLYPRHGWGWRPHFASGRPARESKRGSRKQHFVRILSQELGLSQRQMQEIRPMLDQAREKLYETRLTAIAQYDQVVLDLGNSIRSSLDSDQTKKLDELTQRFRERRRRKKERLKQGLERLRASQGSPPPGS